MKIGDFSRLANIPVKTIRYYAEIGLLNPEFVDKENRYRQYGVKQLIELNRILALKEAGFALEEISQMHKRPMPQDEIMSLLESKLVIAKNEQLLAAMRITNLEARIKHIKYEEDYQMTDITVKKVETILVASIRKKCTSPDECAGFYGIIDNDIKSHGIKEIGPWMVLRHDGSFRDGKFEWGYWGENDWEACVQIEKEYSSQNPNIKVYSLPSVEKMASYIHKGEWGNAMKPSMESFFEWLNLNGMQFVYPYREIFHYGEREDPDWSTFVTEVQFPIK